VGSLSISLALPLVKGGEKKKEGRGTKRPATPVKYEASTVISIITITPFTPLSARKRKKERRERGKKKKGKRGIKAQPSPRSLLPFFP